MKVFDFSNGTKGKQVGEIAIAAQIGGWNVRKGDATYRVKLADSHGGPADRWEWSTGASTGANADIKPEDFGVEAICFCTGELFHQWHPGHPEAESHWSWHVVGTNDWNRAACKSGILKAERIA